MLGETVETDLRAKARVGLEIGDGGETLEVGVADIRLGEQHDGFGWQTRLVAAAERNLAAEDGLHALRDGGLAELQGAEEVAGVGEGHRRHAVRRRQARELVGLDGTFTQRIGRVGVEVNEGLSRN